MNNKRSFLLGLMSIIALLLAMWVVNELHKASVDPITAEEVNQVLIAHNLQPIDVTEQALNSFGDVGLQNCIIAEKDDMRFEYYAFDNSAAARAVYRKAYDIIKIERMAVPRREIENGRRNYLTYSLEAAGMYSITVSANNTAVYAYCNAENSAILNDILISLGFINVVKLPGMLSGAGSVLQIFLFILYAVFALVGRSFYWRAACSSAGITQHQIDKEEKQRAELYAWLVEKSSRKTTTTIILFVHKIYLLPEFFGIAMAVIACFTANVSDIVEFVGMYLPIFVIFTALLGSGLDRHFRFLKHSRG